ncbi:hypothetical protein ACM46_10425 [Chryseobacterium angstadtii]|uniref:Uncharacterized protein n=1 Tax=Chryseobacterium angstadtii TaxID=558151 RepID=A0A0J7L6H0_9FLAO|nr:hypothetical protein ACM46_10425 [Chryseobacterium angstadtii]
MIYFYLSENYHRIKAVGMVSAVNIGSMFRNGWENDVKDAEALSYLLAGHIMIFMINRNR